VALGDLGLVTAGLDEMVRGGVPSPCRAGGDVIRLSAVQASPARRRSVLDLALPTWSAATQEGEGTGVAGD